MPIQSHTPNSLKASSLQYFQGGAGAHLSSFFHSRGVGPTTFNPLSLQARPTFSYNPFLGHGHGFGDDVKPPVNEFQSMNAAANSLGYNAFPASSDDNNLYSSASLGQRDLANFDI